MEKLEEKNKTILTTNTLCNLNDTNSCIPNKIINYIYEKTISENVSTHKFNKTLIIDKISNECNCQHKKKQDEKELCLIKNISNYIINRDEKDCIMYNYFKPKGEYDSNAWLDNTHIDVIQEQLYKKYSGYYYSFIHMIDNIMIQPKNTKCIQHTIKPITEINFINEITKINNILTENGDLKYYSVVYNTDPSYKNGQHWFCIFFNFSTEPYTLEYFNSSGMDIQDNNFKYFLEKIIFDINYNLDKKIIYKKVSDIQHQDSKTGNCGIYSLYYIWSRLENVPLNSFNDPTNIINDEMMVKFRKVFFTEKI